MGSILIGLLVDVVVIVVTALIAFTIGKQSRTTELVERESQIESLRHHLERKTQTIDYLRAENDHWQTRVRRLEGHIVQHAHLHAVPPMPPTAQTIDDIEQLGAAIYRQSVAKRRLDSSPVDQESLLKEAMGLSVVKKEVKDALSGIPVSQLMQRKET